MNTKFSAPQQLQHTGFEDYELLDSGNFFRLERFGKNVIKRYDPTLIYKAHPKRTEIDIAAKFATGKSGELSWNVNEKFNEDWKVQYLPSVKHSKDRKPLVFELGISGSKNIGLFPEQASHWQWLAHKIATAQHEVNVLNLFGHTGAASLVAAWAGAKVCHVDSSQAAINWAKRNQTLSDLTKAPIRWIKDDCTTFVKREIKRDRVYDAVILDPPAFGRDAKGRTFKFEKDIAELLGLVKQVVSPHPSFFIMNSYATGLSENVTKNLVADQWPQAKIEYGELTLREKESYGRFVSCNTFARFAFNE
ncbi:class I SAM-dependent methyltransferase [Candidatus Babeliales bacterium]|nr:class I SAM-dependent methyltransferase [Candidatus Babeliales bacterium]